MMDAAAQLREEGIVLKDTRPGRHYTTCPQCSGRRKGTHQLIKVLGVTIEHGGAHWGCNHCSWTGAVKSDKPNGAGKPDPNIYYDYADENGELLFQKVRGPNKKFWQRKPDGKGGWITKLGDTRKVVYRLPQLNEAIAAGYTIIAVEGEKDADNLWRIGLPATCNPDGAAKPGQKPKWRPEYAEMLRGADVVVMGDNDDAGRAHAEATANACTGIAARVRTLDLAKYWPGCPKGGDISDWLKAGHTREQLDALVEQAPDFGTEGKPSEALTLRLSDWLSRDLPAPDFILGDWLTTTSRALVVAPTGLGKTMLGMGMTLAVASGNGFLHWHGVRPCRALFIDGEMSRRLLKQRLADEARRLGMCPDGMHALSHEDDAENFAPLNTQKGQAFIDHVIERIGGVDLITFDNIMSLISGEMKDEESWRQTLPWILSLTHRNIGQMWVHHTGHDETRSYGTKTKEWMPDTVMHLERVERPGTDVSFSLSFRKARERTPTTRSDFAEVNIALVDDQWTSEGEVATRKGKKPSALGGKFLDALRNATIDSAERMHHCPAATLAAWRAECTKLGLIEPDMKPDAARSLFSKYKRELIALNLVACSETHAWMPGAQQLPLKSR